ncbi:MAG: prephenate dehydrogenase/arogenate dehydrogenase family protein [Elusimicrobium sp.]|jgi:prephenate dehydrogenase|nr:prephenate dehydrogenase/arogenate dehydrogenase family protein [Elusimicrobium sp.]
MKKVSIIGFGRFGKVLYKMLEKYFDVTVYDKDKNAFKDYKIKPAKNIAEVFESDVIFYAVPINKFEKTIKEHKNYFKDQLLIDVLSVKTLPKKTLKKYTENTGARVILTHPMFGPDSLRYAHKNLPVVIENMSAKPAEYKFWKDFFTKQGLKVIEMSAAQHDKQAAMSQGLAHFMGRLLQGLRIKPAPIDTVGAKQMQQIKEFTCNDTWELFRDLQNFNPYTKKMRLSLGRVYDSLYNKLLPEQKHKDYVIIGIQGGKGSFCEEAAWHYIKEKNIKNFEIKYLYTTERVLKRLHNGDIDLGIFAMHNAIGGIVHESTHALARHKVRIADEFAIRIRHFLMKLPGVPMEKITKITAHPQVFLQCRGNLLRKYFHLKLESGKGDLIDTAQAAAALAAGKLDKNTAILGPAALAQMYKLETVDGDLQDDDKNYTSFFVVKR